MPVADSACGKAAAFRCPYHSWTFNLDGSVKAIPNQRRFPGLNPEVLGLVPIALDEHAGFVFINLEPQPAQSLAAFLGHVAPCLDATPLAPLGYSDTLSHAAAAPWKGGLRSGRAE